VWYELWRRDDWLARHCLEVLVALEKEQEVDDLAPDPDTTIRTTVEEGEAQI
jgi:hypothetical protein